MKLLQAAYHFFWIAAHECVTKRHGVGGYSASSKQAHHEKRQEHHVAAIERLYPQ